MAARWLTPSNGLTSLRLLAAPLFYCTLVESSWLWAAALFWGAVASDLADGRIARARGETSSFGGFLDHGSDATFVCLGLLALAMQERVPYLLPILVATAFIQYTFDSRVLAGRPLRASALGRWNGILYFVPLGTVVTREALSLGGPGDVWVGGMAWLLILTTIVSIGDRATTFWAAWRRSSPQS